MKKTIISLISLILLIPTTDYNALTQGTQLQEFLPYDRFSSWKQICFDNLPEGDSHAKTKLKTNPKPKPNEKVLSPYQLKKEITKFITKSKTDKALTSKDLWIQTNEKNNNKPINLKNKNEWANPYAQKLNLTPYDNICFIGDIHGSVHSLLRNLQKLIDLGHLNNNFKTTKPNFYMIFLGDNEDYGRWGIEVWYTLLKLKNNNWDKVFLIRGNHEKISLSLKYGFKEELQIKYPIEFNNLLNNMYNIYELLPLAIFAKCKNKAIQCCHGGIDPNYSPKNLLENKNKIFEQLPKNCVEGLLWSDFNGKPKNKIVKSKRGAGYEATMGYTQNYLKDNNLIGFIRGHQDQQYGCKIFTQKDKHLQYWKKIIINSTEIPLIDYPVITLTTAKESKKLPHDCFGILTIKNWKMNIYEIYN